MKMSRSKCIKLFELMIEGRPAESILQKHFTKNETAEISRQLNIGKFATFTDEELANVARKALVKIA